MTQKFTGLWGNVKLIMAKHLIHEKRKSSFRAVVFGQVVIHSSMAGHADRKRSPWVGLNNVTSQTRRSKMHLVKNVGIPGRETTGGNTSRRVVTWNMWAILHWSHCLSQMVLINNYSTSASWIRDGRCTFFSYKNIAFPAQTEY